MNKSQIISLIREEIYKLSNEVIDEKTQILTKTLKKYNIAIKELPKGVVDGALDAMDLCKEEDSLTGNTTSET